MITRFHIFEGIRDKMTPKSEEDVMRGFETADPEDILEQSFKNQFTKGLKYVLDNYRLYGKETKSIVRHGLPKIKNKEDMRYLLDQEQITKFLNKEHIYILEKYVLGLHKDELHDYEKCLIKQLDETNYYQSEDNPDIMVGKNQKGDKNFFIYNKVTKHLTHHLDNMSAWIVCKDDSDNYESHRGDDVRDLNDLGWGYKQMVLCGVISDYYDIEITGESGSRNDSYSFRIKNMEV